MECGEKKGAKRVKDETDADLASPKAAKKKRAAAGASVVQKREGVYRPTASKQVRDRMARVKSQRMYLVSSTIQRDAGEDSDPADLFLIHQLGSKHMSPPPFHGVLFR